MWIRCLAWLLALTGDLVQPHTCLSSKNRRKHKRVDRGLVWELHWRLPPIWWSVVISWHESKGVGEMSEMKERYKMNFVNEPCWLGTNFADVECSLYIAVGSELQLVSHILHKLWYYFLLDLEKLILDSSTYLLQELCLLEYCPQIEEEVIWKICHTSA